MPALVTHSKTSQTGDQEVKVRTPLGPATLFCGYWNIFCGRSLPSVLVQEGRFQFLAKECAQVLVNCLGDAYMIFFSDKFFPTYKNM